jgi:hypothetical protein
MCGFPVRAGQKIFDRTPAWKEDSPPNVAPPHGGLKQGDQGISGAAPNADCPIFEEVSSCARILR